MTDTDSLNHITKYLLTQKKNTESTVPVNKQIILTSRCLEKKSVLLILIRRPSFMIDFLLQQNNFLFPSQSVTYSVMSKKNCWEHTTVGRVLKCVEHVHVDLM